MWLHTPHHLDAYGVSPGQNIPQWGKKGPKEQHPKSWTPWFTFALGIPKSFYIAKLETTYNILMSRFDYSIIVISNT